MIVCIVVVSSLFLWLLSGYVCAHFFKFSGLLYVTLSTIFLFARPRCQLVITNRHKLSLHCGHTIFYGFLAMLLFFGRCCKEKQLSINFKGFFLDPTVQFHQRVFFACLPYFALSKRGELEKLFLELVGCESWLIKVP